MFTSRLVNFTFSFSDFIEDDVRVSRYVRAWQKVEQARHLSPALGGVRE